MSVMAVLGDVLRALAPQSAEAVEKCLMVKFFSRERGLTIFFILTEHQEMASRYARVGLD